MSVTEYNQHLRPRLKNKIVRKLVRNIKIEEQVRRN